MNILKGVLDINTPFGIKELKCKEIYGVKFNER